MRKIKKIRLFLWIFVFGLNLIACQKLILHYFEQIKPVDQLVMNQSYNDLFMINKKNQLIVLEDYRYDFVKDTKGEEKGHIIFSIQSLEKKGEDWILKGESKMIFLVFNAIADAKRNIYDPVYSNLTLSNRKLTNVAKLKKINNQYYFVDSLNKKRIEIKKSNKKIPSSVEEFLSDFKEK
ncbi:MAG: hypothetical protein LBV67_00105 [Streptococcaceae bacterium]|jgi:hypothetical protein|nr:hypothetical protein [Streptococcaceae bacterium]